MDEESLTRAEFTAAFERVVDEILKLKKQNSADVQGIMDLFEKVRSKLEKDKDATFSEMKAEVKDAFDKAFKDQQNTLNFLRDKMRDHKNMMDDRDDSLRNEMKAMIPPPQEFSIPQEIPDSIESLQLKVKTLEDEIKALGEKRLGGGGGTSAIGVQWALGKMIKSETPSGDINGVNLAYTVTQEIHAVLQFGINGMVIHDSEYTVAGKTITFTTAIPAALSGTTFRITYV